METGLRIRAHDTAARAQLDDSQMAPLHREDLKGEFPLLLDALCRLLGKSYQAMAEAIDMEPKQFWQYRSGRRIPAGAEMLNLVRLASGVEGGLELLLGLRPELIDRRERKWPPNRRRRAVDTEEPPASDPGVRFLRRLRGSR